MKKGLIILLLTLCINTWGQVNNISSQGKPFKTSIIAHRGYWDCEGSAQNSITSLVKSAEIEVYGAEFDVQITKDGIAVINHDPAINGNNIETSSFSEIKDQKLINNENISTLEQYLLEGKKHPSCKLILEIKPHKEMANENRCIEETLRLIDKTETMQQIEFISFSWNVCVQLVAKCPGTAVQYLSGDKSPQEIKKAGLTGIDYNGSVLRQKHPEWIEEAHRLGLTVNVWTINNTEGIQYFTDKQVDFITTNNPVEALEISNNKIKQCQ